jgi:hypothetical protein
MQLGYLLPRLDELAADGTYSWESGDRRTQRSLFSDGHGTTEAHLTRA